MITAILICMELAGAAVLCWQAVDRLNRMTRRTRCVIAIAWAMVGGAAIATLDHLARTHTPDWRVAVLVTAVAVLTLMDRRRSS